MKQMAWHKVIVLLLFLPSPLLVAQSATVPALHHRGDPDTTDRPVVVKKSRANLLIPDDASGEYMLGHPGEVVEITIQFGDLSGYISRQGDGDSDSGTPLTFFFDQTSMHGQELRFTTRQIHDLWYSFQGTIVRGPGKTKEDEGYYLLEGELTEHDTEQKTELRRSVSLKSGRQFN